MNKSGILALSALLTIVPKTAHASNKTAWETTTPLQEVTESIELNVQSAFEPIAVQTPGLTRVWAVPREQTGASPAKELTLQELAKQMVESEFGKGQFASFDKIITRESRWNPNAVNRSSGACGLPQALPCSKIKDKSPVGQLQWAIAYMKNRYGTPNAAWNFWQAHGWY